MALIAVASAWGCRSGAGVEPLCDGCNVVLVSLDTLRADHLGAYGYERPTSPHFDALAADAILFENALSQSAWTRAAHATMFTGLYPHEHGIVGFAGNARLVAEVPTLASVLADHGYRTAAFTGGANMSAHFGFDNGFETYRSPGRRIEDSLDAVEGWLAEVEGEPFFLFVHGFDAHRPYKSEPVDRRALGLPRERVGGMQRACRSGVPREAMAPFVAEYDAAVHCGDRGLGRLLALLTRAGAADRTLVLVTSDHGEEFLEHGRCFHIRTLHREVLHVPFIVRVPGVPSRRVAAPVPASASVASTILDVVGGWGGELPGPSLAPVLAGAPVSAPFVVSETTSRYVAGRGVGHVRAVTTDSEKLIDYVSQGRRAYYDLTRDPGELAPVDAGRRVEALSLRLAEWVKARPRQPASVAAKAVPSALARDLRALGYVD